jgi:hypothetical protein
VIAEPEVPAEKIERASLALQSGYSVSTYAATSWTSLSESVAG